MQLYVFNADGTLQQSDPDAGDSQNSDSDGKGVWAAEGSHVRGKWIEIMADRATHKFTGRGECIFDISVAGDRLSGHAKMTLLDREGHTTAVVSTALVGERIALR